MGKDTGIAWADDTFSPWWGCVEVSEECSNCYAREFDARFGGDNWGKDGPRRFFGEKHWNEPLRWNAQVARGGYVGKAGPDRRLVFCSSMADVFETHPALDAWRQKLWALIKLTPRLTWLLLTKRPQNIRRMLDPELAGAANVWLGTTVGMPSSSWRADALVNNSSAPVNFLSMEPMLEDTSLEFTGIQWCIQGSESGTTPRPSQSDWYRRTRKECEDSGVRYFLKQMDEGMDGVSDSPPMMPRGQEIVSSAPPYRRRDLRMGADGMKRVKWIIERPYLDGRQSVEFPA